MESLEKILWLVSFKILFGCVRILVKFHFCAFKGAQGSRNSKAKSSTSGEKRKHVRINGDSTENGGRRSRKKSKGHTSTSRKSASKKGSDYNRRGARSLLDRAAKRCVVNYAED